jgi:archaellum component FlaC
MQYLMLLTALDYMEDESVTVNLTMYPRAPSFMKRASGQFIIATLFAILAGLAYPLVYLIGSYMNDAKIYALTVQNNELSAEVGKYKKLLGERKKKIKQLDKEIARLADIYKGKTLTLTSIYDKKVNYRLKSGLYHRIAEELNRFDVHVDMLASQEDTLWLSLVSSDDRKFTELIKYISDNHFDEIDQIDIALIQKDPESNYYKGLLKVDFK